MIETNGAMTGGGKPKSGGMGAQLKPENQKGSNILSKII